MSSDLWPHQVAGCQFTRRHKKVALVHDTGTGKTRTAISLADSIQARRVLVLCPTIAVEHWALQFEQWSFPARSSTIVRSGQGDLAAAVIIVPFSLLSTKPKVVQRLRQYDFDLVIIDEAHALKEPTSIRTQAVYPDLVENVRYVLLLTATLMPNHPAELWSHLHALRPELLAEPGYESFVERYCETATTWRGSTPHETVKGAKKGAPTLDLKRRLSTFIHRIKKQDVQRDLPPLLVDVWPIHVCDLVLPDEVLREWRLAESALLRDVGTATGEEALALAKASPHAATQRRLTGILKTQAIVALLAQALEQPKQKIIVFSYHTAVIDQIAQSFSRHGVVTLDGRTPASERFARVQAFQTNPRVRMFNGQIMTAGESIDLTASSLVWIVENDWSPKTLTQAIGRAHRPGQKEPVTVRLLSLSGSIDDAITRTLARKTKDIEMLMEV